MKYLTESVVIPSNCAWHEPDTPYGNRMLEIREMGISLIRVEIHDIETIPEIRAIITIKNKHGSQNGSSFIMVNGYIAAKYRFRFADPEFVPNMQDFIDMVLSTPKPREPYTRIP